MLIGSTRHLPAPLHIHLDCGDTFRFWPRHWSDTLHTIWAYKSSCSSCLLLVYCDWQGQSSSHTLHLAAQLLNSLYGGFVVMWELLSGGNRVGTGAVWQAALRGALIRRSLLLPVQMVFHQELQLWNNGKKRRWKVSDEGKIGRTGRTGSVGRCWGKENGYGRKVKMKAANGRAAHVKGE